ncbi:MAG: YkgJ family cysteine cluster protein [Chitinispirillaceae bacterium]|jgi:Fe-S-cluster containining protein
MPELQIFKVYVETPDGALAPAEVAISDASARLADLVAPVHELVNGVVALAVGRAQQEGRKLSCRAGCGVCCRQLVPLAPAEAFFIVDRLLAMPAADRRPILKRFQMIENNLAEARLITRISALGDTDDNNRVAMEYFAQALSCPFLESSSCSIHAWRPIACREYNVTSCPELCADPFRNRIETVHLHRRMSEGLARFCTHVAGVPLGLVPMPLLFDYFETHREVAARTWPGIELFGQVLDFVLGKRE